MRPLTHTKPISLSRGMCCLVIAAAGFIPVGSIAFHSTQLLTLPLCLAVLVIPAVALLLLATLQYPELKKTVGFGWMAGITAVAIYDLSRVPYIVSGWNDFIPQIGAWALNSTQPDALVGYLWRYAGNGGGMGIAFFVLMKHFRPYGNMVQNGILYGLFISLH